MKKILCIAMILFGFVSVLSAQKYSITREEPLMFLPDGALADVAFFKKWGDANNYIKAQNKEKIVGKKSVAKSVEIDAYLGYANIWHQVEAGESKLEAFDNALYKAQTGVDKPKEEVKIENNIYIKKLYDVMKECDATYGVAYASFEKRVRQYTFTFDKKGRVRNSFFDYFDESHDFYKAYVAGDTNKMELLNKMNVDTMENIFIFNLRELKGKDSEEFKQELNKARHRAIKMTGPGFLDLSSEFTVYLIYSDDGVCFSTTGGFTIDSEGRFRTYNYNNCVVFPDSSVDNDTKVAAQNAGLYVVSSQKSSKNGNTANSNTQSSSASQVKSEDVEKWYIRGTEYYEEKDFENAINAFTQVINIRLEEERISQEEAKARSRNPDIYQFTRNWTVPEMNSYYYRGKCYYYLKNYDAAIADFLVCRNNVKSQYAYNYDVNIGDAYGAKKDYENAVKYYKYYVEGKPDSESINFKVDKTNPADMWFCAVLWEKNRLSGEQKYDKWLKEITEKNKVTLSEIEDFYKKNRGW